MPAARTLLLDFAVVVLNTLRTEFVQTVLNIDRVFEHVETHWTQQSVLQFLKQIEVYVVIIIFGGFIHKDTWLACHLVEVQVY